MAELIRAKVGEAFEVPLQATPTAGFRWELLFPTEAADLVDFVGTHWQQMQPGLIGGSATQVFRFKAVAPGELSLVFEYRRPWEVSERKRQAVHVAIAGRPGHSMTCGPSCVPRPDRRLSPRTGVAVERPAGERKEKPPRQKR